MAFTALFVTSCVKEKDLLQPVDNGGGTTLLPLYECNDTTASGFQLPTGGFTTTLYSYSNTRMVSNKEIKIAGPMVQFNGEGTLMEMPIKFNYITPGFTIPAVIKKMYLVDWRGFKIGKEFVPAPDTNGVFVMRNMLTKVPGAGKYRVVADVSTSAQSYAVQWQVLGYTALNQPAVTFSTPATGPKDSVKAGSTYSATVVQNTKTVTQAKLSDWTEISSGTITVNGSSSVPTFLKGLSVKMSCKEILRDDEAIISDVRLTIEGDVYEIGLESQYSDQKIHIEIPASFQWLLTGATKSYKVEVKFMPGIVKKAYKFYSWIEDNDVLVYQGNISDPSYFPATVSTGKYTVQLARSK